jgi:hypothetical protein
LVARKVGKFTQERQAKAYGAGLRKELAERHPNVTPDQAQRYERKINELVAEFQKDQAQPQQERQPAGNLKEGFRRSRER